MAKYDVEAKQLLELLGGADNIASVSHCVTRMRFVLNDVITDTSKIEDLACVKGVFTQAGQFQVIIGNTVGEFYNSFISVSGIEGASKEALKAAAKKNQNIVQRAMSNLAEIFAPLIPALVIGGLILGFRNVLEGINLVKVGDEWKPLTDVYQFWDGVNAFLWLPGEAIFHFLPVGITWSVVKKMGGTQILGIVLGICLVSPQLLNAYGVAGGDAVPFWDFGYFKIEKIGYQAQVIPAMLAGFTLVYLERLFQKITHQSIQMIVVPFMALVPAIILAHTIIGPFGWWVGRGFSSAVNWGLSGQANWLFAALFGFLYAPLVITGLHHMTNAIDLQLIADIGGTNLWPMIAISNIAQGSAVLAIALMHRKNKKEQQVAIPAVISAYLGVTEPAMFGINIKYVYPFVAAMVGSAVAGLFSVATGVFANSIGVGGLPGILSIKADHMALFAIAMALAIAIPIVLTFIFEKTGFLVKGKNKTKNATATNGAWALEGASGAAPKYDYDATATQNILSNRRTTNSDDLVMMSGSSSTGSKATVGNVSSRVSNNSSIFAIDELLGSAKENTVSDTIEFKAPVSGQVITLKEVEDGVFSEGILGEGLAIIPTDGALVAPVDGIVTVVISESNHAVGLTTDDGVEILLHIGLDTVNMKGEGFFSTVKQGQKVKAGETLIKFDIEKIKAAGYPTTTMMVISNANGKKLKLVENDNVVAGGDVVLSLVKE